MAGKTLLQSLHELLLIFPDSQSPRFIQINQGKYANFSFEVCAVGWFENRGGDCLGLGLPGCEVGLDLGSDDPPSPSPEQANSLHPPHHARAPADK